MKAPTLKPYARIPIDSIKKGGDYAVMVGFQLDEEQLKHNRELLRAEEAARRKEIMRQKELERLLQEQKEQKEQKEQVISQTPTASPPPVAETETMPISIIPAESQ